MSADITSDAISCAYLDNLSIQLDWSGTPDGSFKVQASNDHEEVNQGGVAVVTIPGSWVDIPLSTTITATGSADDAQIALNQIPGPYVRVVYTASSGTGSLNCFVSGKGI